MMHRERKVIDRNREIVCITFSDRGCFEGIERNRFENYIGEEFSKKVKQMSTGINAEGTEES